MVAGFLLLQCYPVAGSQVWCALILFPVVGAVAIHEWLRHLSCRQGWWSSTRLQARLVGLLVAALFCWKGMLVGHLWRHYERNERTGLPGTVLFRLPAEQAGTLRWLVENLRRYDTFVTMPGYISLYFWTGKEPPSLLNTTTWMTLLDDERQRQIVDSLARFNQVGGVRNREHAAAWAQDQDIRAKPLVQFMEQRMKIVGARDNLELLEAIGP
jgi:hypothetical protein